MSRYNNCIRCNAGMPSWRVNNLCEECYAEERQGDYEYDPTDDDIPGLCPHCNGTGRQDCGDVSMECPECNDGEEW